MSNGFRNLAGAILALLLLHGAMPPGAAAQEIHAVGEIIGLDGSSITIRTLDGRRLSVRYDARTGFEREGRGVGSTALAVGARVVVDAETVDGVPVARFIRLGSDDPPDPGPGRAPRSPTGVARSNPSHAVHAGHDTPPGMPRPTSHDHAANPAMAMPDESRLWSSDMNRMAGMTAAAGAEAASSPDWQVMTMGVARLVANNQGGPSGSDALESSNWFMLMAARDVANGRLTLMMMNSLEPATVPRAGSPALFQVGESIDGHPLVDRQHPHDFFMNLSATWSRRLGANSAWWVQAALRGEPALGPTAFMHRASAGENPAAALGHHQQDATHITDDVITIGAGHRALDAEISVFHGAEPDEERWDLDPGTLDSVSGRLRVRAGADWTGQLSHGYLHEPEALEPGDTHRTTASAHYRPDGGGPLAASLVWGRNREDHGTFDAWLAELAWQATGADHLFVRLEQVERDPHLLASKGATDEAEETPAVTVGAATIGYLREFRPSDSRLRLGVGGDMTAYVVPEELVAVYDDGPLSLHLFVRIRWDGGHGDRAGGGHSMGH